MSRPHVTVNLTTALTQRGSPTATGRAMMAFTGGTPVTGTLNPMVVTSPDQVTAAYGTAAPIATLATQVGVALACGAPDVAIVQCTGAAATLVQAEWAAGLNLLTDDFNAVAQVAIPGVTTSAAQAALADHANNFPSRTVFLDAPGGTSAAALVTLAGVYSTAAAAQRVTVAAPPVTYSATAGTLTTVPASVCEMGLAGRGDAAAGHTNQAPAGDQLGRGMGVLAGGAVAPVDVFSSSDRDLLNNAGVSVIRMSGGLPTLYGWASVSTDPRFHQLSAGRFAGQVYADVDRIGRSFLFTPLDATAFSSFEGALKDQFEIYRKLRALWTGLDGTHAGYAINVAGVNTAATIAAQTLAASVSLSLNQFTEQVVVNVLTSNATTVG